jgi:hypothetical protein
MPELMLEYKFQEDTSEVAPGISFTPKLGDDYWTYRVWVSEDQAVLGFPKFFTIGIGFMVEDDDWNTNLPYTSDAEVIYKHIKGNKGPTARKKDCLKAIEMIQEAATKDKGVNWG